MGGRRPTRPKGGRGRGGAAGPGACRLLVRLPVLSPPRMWASGTWHGRSARRHLECLCASLHPRACLGQWQWQGEPLPLTKRSQAWHDHRRSCRARGFAGLQRHNSRRNI
ncbi:unnamed protein product [Coccothraustes coccothraustes]